MDTLNNEHAKAPAKFRYYGGTDFYDFPAPLRIVITGRKEAPIFSVKPGQSKPATPGQPKPENPNPNPKPEKPRPVTREEPGKGAYTLPGDKPLEPGDKPIRPVERNKWVETAPKKNEEEDEEEDDEDYMDEEGDEYELNEGDNDEKEFDEREDTAF